MKYKILFLCLCLAGSAWVIYRLVNPSTPVFAEVVSGYPECHNCIPIPSEATVLLFHDKGVETDETITVTYTHLGLFGRSEGIKTFTKMLEPVKSTFFTRVEL